MQQDPVEVVFCDLCGSSVPASDLANGTALRHQGKVLGACCVAAIRSPAAAARSGEARGNGAEGRLLPVAIVLLAALAAVTIFLDQKISGAETSRLANHDQVVQALRSDSEVLQAVGVAMDGVARKSDLDGFAERLATVEGGAQLNHEQQRQQSEQLRQALVALQQELRQRDAAAIDYRPLFDDLRQQLQRQAAALADLRAAPAVPETRPEEPAPRPAEAAAADPTGLPAALMPAVQKLSAADPAVRFEAVDELLRSKHAAVLPHLLPLARDADGFVRRLTVEGLRDFKHADAVEALLAALADAEENVRDTAWRSLKELTGQKIPFEASAAKEARGRAVQRWQEWWEKNKATFGS